MSNVSAWLLAGMMMIGGSVVAEQDAVLSPAMLREALEKAPEGAAAEALCQKIRAMFGKEALTRGTAVRIDELTVAWALETIPLHLLELPRVLSDDGEFSLPLQRVGGSWIFAGVANLSDGEALKWKIQVNTEAMGGGNLEVYRTHPDSLPRPDVPHGAVREMPRWQSRVFTGTSRAWWVYVPAQYRESEPACVMVFQDGQGYKDFVPAVFDNLIATGEMPVTVGVFVQPGTFADGRSNRSYEYDTLSDQYARFLLEEILPETEKIVKLRHDAASRAIAGISSGGICAFTVAWQRPNEFSKVLSWVGSFTNIASGASLREGGHNYPALIRKTPKKAIRVFLQDGENDLDNAHGSWPLSNLQMEKALAFAGYDYKFVYGSGFHSNRHGRAILPDSLRWLWR